MKSHTKSIFHTTFLDNSRDFLSYGRTETAYTPAFRQLFFMPHLSWAVPNVIDGGGDGAVWVVACVFPGLLPINTAGTVG